jgi:hypothetical protein
MNGIKEILNIFITKNENGLVKSNLNGDWELKKYGFTKQFIESELSWENVLMVLSDLIIFTQDSIIVQGEDGRDNQETINLSGISFNFIKIKIKDIENLGGKPVTGGNILWKSDKDLGYLSYKDKIVTLIGKSDNPILTLIEELKKIIKELELKNEKIQKEKQLEQDQLKENEINLFKKDKSNVLSSFDTTGDGKIDVIDEKDFMVLFQKHQKKIIEIDRNYIQQFVKVSSYLKTKKENVQVIFDSIKNISNQKDLNEYVGILENEIHIYKLILFNSLNMIVSLVEDDMITFYQIHESFDKLNMFNSNWENEVSNKLTNIGDGLNDLMYNIENMGNKIVSEIGHLSYVTEQSNKVLSNQLKEIDSSITTNNLLTGIQTYQMYKINKNTKSLN